MLIESIPLNLPQVSLVHILTYTHKVTEGSWKWNLTTRETTAIFSLWNFHLAIFRHLHMACTFLSIYLRWYDLPMPVVSIMNFSIEGCCKQGSYRIRASSVIFEVIISKCSGRHHDLVNRHRISVSQLITDIIRVWIYQRGNQNP